MNVPSRIKMTAYIQDRASAGMFAFLSFGMSRKNAHHFIFGPSNAEGQIEVTGQQILKESRKNQDLFIMDYAHLPSFWTGSITVSPMNREALQRALYACRLFRKFEYPPNYEQDLLAAEAMLGRTPDAELSITVLCEPKEAAKIQPVRVSAT